MLSNVTKKTMAALTAAAVILTAGTVGFADTETAPYAFVKNDDGFYYSDSFDGWGSGSVNEDAVNKDPDGKKIWVQGGQGNASAYNGDKSLGIFKWNKSDGQSISYNAFSDFTKPVTIRMKLTLEKTAKSEAQFALNTAGKSINILNLSTAGVSLFNSWQDDVDKHVTVDTDTAVGHTYYAVFKFNVGKNQADAEIYKDGAGMPIYSEKNVEITNIWMNSKVCTLSFGLTKTDLSEDASLYLQDFTITNNEELKPGRYTYDDFVLYDGAEGKQLQHHVAGEANKKWAKNWISWSGTWYKKDSEAVTIASDKTAESIAQYKPVKDLSGDWQYIDFGIKLTGGKKTGKIAFSGETDKNVFAFMKISEDQIMLFPDNDTLENKEKIIAKSAEGEKLSDNLRFRIGICGETGQYSVDIYDADTGERVGSAVNNGGSFSEKLTGVTDAAERAKLFKLNNTCLRFSAVPVDGEISSIMLYDVSFSNYQRTSGLEVYGKNSKYTAPAAEGEQGTLSTETCIKNNGDPMKFILITALYDEKGELKNIRINNAENSGNGTLSSVVGKFSVDSDKYKAVSYIWDGENNMRPIMGAFSNGTAN